ncbi:hypothetical protein TNCT_698831 [Trichonephila clavata]|uniref:Uncharacterized protein n=1 Tax=Trichonephila clavata TaxID=2740835 RepID=A0A8X6FXB6_TRICU|nr:hypothetical protein TNCT_698831 [Trichonephila clavata]
MQYYWNEYTNFRGEAKHSEHFLFIYVNHNDKKIKRQEELATAALHSTGGCISRTSISKHSTGPADDSFSRSLLQFGGTPERGIHPDTLEPTPGSFQSPMEHRNEAHTTPLLPDGFRWTSKISQVQNLSFSPLPAQLRRPIHSELLATFLHLSRRRGSRHRGPHEPAPSSGGPRKISKSKTTRSRHHLRRLHHSHHSILSRLPHEPRTHSTSPDGLAPVTGARTRQRPLPVDLEKFRSPLPLSHQTRSTYLRASHEPCSTSPVTGARMPSSGGLLDTLNFFFFFSLLQLSSFRGPL